MNRYFEIIAAREGKTPEEIEKDIQEALELAWASGDRNHIEAQKKLTGGDTAANLEEFIAAVVEEVQKRR